ncbi:MAG: allophycocyanin [Waterburya sp.]
MLKQLARLSVEADGRYATDQELQFLKNYLQSVDQRIISYEKIRDAEEKILHRLEAEKRMLDKNLFQMGSRDITQICRRDMTMMLRCSAAAMLVDDLDCLREGLLLWYQTIVQAFSYQGYAKINYKILQEVVKMYLDPEEVELIMPALQLNHSLLSQ